MDKYSIALTLTTEQDLELLEPAFRGELDEKSPQSVSDDFLIAAFMGWHLRSMNRRYITASEHVFTEFALRRGVIAGAHHNDGYDEIRRAARGNPSTPGNVLSVDGITTETITQIERRVQKIASLIDELERLESNSSTEEGHVASRKYVAQQSDQAIIDFVNWAILALPSAKNENFPEPYFEELLNRGNTRIA